jgi:pimeloyl-ACP methyl ester carboxylesterase
LNDRKYGLLRGTIEFLLVCTVVPLVILAFYALYMAIKINRMESAVGEVQPDEYKLPFVPLRIPVGTSDIWLNGWLIPAANARTTVIFGQEFRTGKSAKLKYAQFLHQAGYNVILFDNRNYRHPDKEKASFFVISRISEDFAAVLKYAGTLPEVADNDIVLYVFSISTMVVMNLLAKSDYNIKALVFDSGPSASLINMTGGYLDQFRPYIIPSYLNGPVAYPVLKKLYGIAVQITFFPKKWPPRPDLSRMELLFIANEEDGIVPPKQVKKLVDRYSRAEYWVAPGSRHLMAFRDHKEFYKRLVLGFLNRTHHTVVGVQSSE